ncbi:hypothetical protein SRB17_00630 [Streptomyces sp. RB17]|nr:hypothetical protein [Streptomyces sp. RB17]
MSFSLSFLVVLTLLTSMVLIGLPHGWKTATSWADIWLCFSWIARILVPATVFTHLVIRLCRHAWTPRPRPSWRDGPHR